MFNGSVKHQKFKHCMTVILLDTYYTSSQRIHHVSEYFALNTQRENCTLVVIIGKRTLYYMYTIYM